jgi:cytosine/adenosine deaminase-related metal-dependent hydrolase
MGIHELLASGTTTILDMATVRHTDEIFKAARLTGIRANIGKCLMDHPETTPPSLREPTARALEEASALFRKWNGAENDRLRVSYAPRFVVSCTERLLTNVALLAREQGALIHTHASENLKEIQLVKKLVNCENVEYLDGLGLTGTQLVLAHCIWLKPHEMEILRATRTNVVHCPSSNLKLASGIARVPEMLAKKINVALGADGAPCNNNLNMFQEMRLAALIQKPGSGPKAIRAQEALDMATLNGARALHWEKDIGSIEVGKKADFSLVDLNTLHNRVRTTAKVPSSESVASALVYSTLPENVRSTHVDGKCVFSRGPKGAHLTAISTARILEKVRRAEAALGFK